jgi:hypothetical protein
MTGKSASLAPLRILATRDRGYCVAECQRSGLLALAYEERIGANYKRTGPQLENGWGRPADLIIDRYMLSVENTP